MTSALRVVLGLVAALALAFGGAACTSTTTDAPTTAASSPSAERGSNPGGSSSAATPGPRSSSPKAPASDVPQRVVDTLRHIDAGDWPDAAHAPGTHGGDPFGNREGRLPKKGADGKSVSYKEWDVNAKKQGQGRDAERIITGSDGSAWFTLDHYSTFTQIR